MALLSIVPGKEIKPYVKYIVAAIAIIALVVFIKAQIKKAKRAKGLRGVYDEKDIDPNYNFAATAKRIYDVFVTPVFNSGADMGEVLKQIIALNDSEFIYLYNTYNDLYGNQKINFGLNTIVSMRDAINYPWLLLSPEKDAVNSRFDRLNLA